MYPYNTKTMQLIICKKCILNGIFLNRNTHKYDQLIKKRFCLEIHRNLILQFCQKQNQLIQCSQQSDITNKKDKLKYVFISSWFQDLLSFSCSVDSFDMYMHSILFIQFDTRVSESKDFYLSLILANFQARSLQIFPFSYSIFPIQDYNHLYLGPSHSIFLILYSVFHFIKWRYDHIEAVTQHCSEN